ncbi:MAG: hypothetical protein IAE66_03805 [Xanthomonadaceae bacterium]|nr:hypothetical protein [Xanthomonadaceae bacterium]
MSADGAVAVAGFPQACLPHAGNGLPIEVTLIARLARGAGDALIEAAAQRQREHPGFVDALDEPSVRIGALHDRAGDRSTVFSFLVGAAGHPFHRHAGHRMFTAIAGSGGARLLFSTADDTAGFVEALCQVRVPADALITVRFGGGTWHRFLPGQPGCSHPTLFALSCHPDETGGALTEEQRDAVATGRADLPALTELLPAELAIEVDGLDLAAIPSIELKLPGGAP